MINPHKEIFKKKKTLKLSNYKLAKATGLGRQTIDRYQKFPESKVTFETVQKLCNFLDIKLN